mmetsp:Transcript_22887/g.70333  ORF Transcript_22887/g.70333 Transcript_22887/m.70333 type:complete len:434 (-) Transcript_22887:333-1634(-)
MASLLDALPLTGVVMANFELADFATFASLCRCVREAADREAEVFFRRRGAELYPTLGLASAALYVRDFRAATMRQHELWRGAVRRTPRTTLDDYAFSAAVRFVRDAPLTNDTTVAADLPEVAYYRSSVAIKVIDVPFEGPYADRFLRLFAGNEKKDLAMDVTVVRPQSGREAGVLHFGADVSATTTLSPASSSGANRGSGDITTSRGRRSRANSRPTRNLVTWTIAALIHASQCTSRPRPRVRVTLGRLSRSSSKPLSTSLSAREKETTGGAALLGRRLESEKKEKKQRTTTTHDDGEWTITVAKEEEGGRHNNGRHRRSIPRGRVGGHTRRTSAVEWRRGGGGGWRRGGRWRRRRSRRGRRWTGRSRRPRGCCYFVRRRERVLLLFFQARKLRREEEEEAPRRTTTTRRHRESHRRWGRRRRRRVWHFFCVR